MLYKILVQLAGTLYQLLCIVFFVFHLAWMFDINAVVMIAGKLFKLFGIK